MTFLPPVSSFRTAFEDVVIGKLVYELTVERGASWLDLESKPFHDNVAL